MVIIKLTLVGGAEPELMPVHIDTPAAERDAFHFQPHFLLQRIVTSHANRAACADHSMPRQPLKRTQRPNGLPRASRESGCRSHLAIGSHLPFRNFPNHIREND